MKLFVYALVPRVKVKVVTDGFVSPRSHRGVGIGRDIVLVCGFSVVMKSIKLINMHIGHESSVRVCFAKRSRIYRIVCGFSQSFIFVRYPLDGGSVAISF